LFFKGGSKIDDDFFIGVYKNFNSNSILDSFIFFLKNKLQF